MSDVLRNIRIVLCEPSHPGNIGAAARAMKTMGLAALHLVRPQRFPDPEARWRASRAVDVLERALVHDCLDDALRGTGWSLACSARPRDIAVAEFPAREAARLAVERARAQPVAVVFGNEASGLTSEDVNRCRARAFIPADPDYSSLNLAGAVQVLSYELRTAAVGEGGPALARELATHEELESFYAHLEQVMAATGFFDPDHPRKLMPRLRRLFARAELAREEINILRGILKALARR
jgi:tRNA/rRNA methyltransferase